MANLKLIGGAIGGVIVLGIGSVGGFLAWADVTAAGMLETPYEAHSVDFPVPFPLTEAEIEALRQEKLAERGEDEAGGEGEGEELDVLADVDLEALALERARARGEHYVKGRYVCVGCHGPDFSGGTMIDDPMIGTALGPNITSGGRTAAYTVADWDRAVRHGINKQGLGMIMPIWDFVKMSDRELSDIIAYIRTVPPSDKTQARPKLGPLGSVLAATGKLPLDVAKADHHAGHPESPPEAAVTVEFGGHLIQICRGCHREALEGGPMPFGPPDWPPAGNLTPHENGLKGWTGDDFKTAMRTGKRPDGTMFKLPMIEIVPYANEMTETELEAMWAYLASLPPTATGE